MITVKTFTTKLACPTCRKPAPRTVALTERGAGCDAWEARVHECLSCWRMRAEALGLARTKLREAGDLGETSDGRETWRGAVVDVDGDPERDPVAGALASELLRMGVPPLGVAVIRWRAEDLVLLASVE